MKKLFAAILSVSLILSLAACGSKADKTPADSTDAPTTAAQEQAVANSPVELLTTVWNSYGEDEKFAISGGDATEAKMNEPGAYSIDDAAVLDSALGFPAASVDKIDSAASIVHMMNANTFTCGAYHVKNAADIADLAAAIKENIMQRRWMCGFPDKLVVVTVGDYVVAFFGENETMDTFKTNLTSAFASAQVVSEDAIL